MQVNFSKDSMIDLGQIFDFIAIDNPTRADSFIKELYQKAIDVGLNPNLYPRLPKFKNIRKRSYKGYVILYQIKNEQVYIQNIFNAVRDYTAILTNPRF